MINQKKKNWRYFHITARTGTTKRAQMSGVSKSKKSSNHPVVSQAQPKIKENIRDARRLPKISCNVKLGWMPFCPVLIREVTGCLLCGRCKLFHFADLPKMNESPKGDDDIARYLTHQKWASASDRENPNGTRITTATNTW